MRRRLLFLVLAATAIGLTAALADAKEDVEATLMMPVPDAAPGAEITEDLTLKSVDARGRGSRSAHRVSTSPP